ncbi:MAG TPA: SIS domain-containing protein [Chloroflexota bacterium]
MRQVTELAQSVDLLAVQSVVRTLREARERGACMYIIGNGGSAATASHLAADLANAPRRAGQRPLRVFSLADNSACLSALGNDEGYEQVFAGQLAGCMPGDVLLAISASGNSPNLLAATDLATDRGATTVALLGFDGGALEGVADQTVLVRSPIGAYGPVEDVHLMLGHIITMCLCHA